MPQETKNNVELTGDIVSAYVAANHIQRSELPSLIAEVHSAFTNLGKPASEPVRAEPPVPINKTIRSDYIVSLEDGRRYKSLKRIFAERASPLNNTGRSGVFARTTRWSLRTTQKPAPNSLRRSGSDKFGRRGRRAQRRRAPLRVPIGKARPGPIEPVDLTSSYRGLSLDYDLRAAEGKTDGRT